MDTFIQRFTSNVLKAPKNIALLNADKSLSYVELDKRANSLAATLSHAGTKPGDLIAVFLPESFSLIISILAIWKVSATYVPLDIRNPVSRINLILNDCQPKFIISTLSKFPFHTQAQIIHPKSNMTPHPNTKLNCSLKNLAYIIFTSGSTGTPKGTMLTHRNLSSLMIASENHFPFNQTDTWLLMHSCAFDFSIWEIIGALWSGGTLVVYPRNYLLTNYNFHSIVLKHRVNILNLTPSAYLRFIDDFFIKSLLAENFLRIVIFGGEKLFPHHLAGWLTHPNNKIKFYNCYGLTEATIHASIYLLHADDCQSKKSPIGLPLDNQQFLIVDKNLNPVPPLRIGELLIGGEGLCQGYLNRDQLNKYCFIEINQRRYYKTGDLVRQLNDHCIEYICRDDDQIKLHGHRIELAEIEHAIMQHQNITLAKIAFNQQNQQLTVYYTGKKLAQKDLHSFLQSSLPTYMLPHQYNHLDTLPLTQNGKLDVDQLSKLVLN